MKSCLHYHPNPYDFRTYGNVIINNVWDTHKPIRGMIPRNKPATPLCLTMMEYVCATDCGGKPLAALVCASIRITSNGWFQVDNAPPILIKILVKYRKICSMYI